MFKVVRELTGNEELWEQDLGEETPSVHGTWQFFLLEAPFNSRRGDWEAEKEGELSMTLRG